MLSTAEKTQIAVPLSDVWKYVSVPANWAAQFPGYVSFEEINPNEYTWTIKVGLGGLVRTVKIRVHVTEWNEPTHVAFTLEGITEPISGTGSFNASEVAAGSTEIALELSISGSGSMANMMEAMARPVLPKLGQTFCTRLKNAIEEDAGVAEAKEPRVPWYRRWWLLLRAKFGGEARRQRQKASENAK
jgi:carbon monoxide dehydrogenase subunit G